MEGGGNLVFPSEDGDECNGSYSAEGVEFDWEGGRMQIKTKQKPWEGPFQLDVGGIVSSGSMKVGKKLGVCKTISRKTSSTVTFEDGVVNGRVAQAQVFGQFFYSGDALSKWGVIRPTGQGKITMSKDGSVLQITEGLFDTDWEMLNGSTCVTQSGTIGKLRYVGVKKRGKGSHMEFSNDFYVLMSTDGERTIQRLELDEALQGVGKALIGKCIQSVQDKSSKLEILDAKVFEPMADPSRVKRLLLMTKTEDGTVSWCHHYKWGMLINGDERIIEKEKQKNGFDEEMMDTPWLEVPTETEFVPWEKGYADVEFFRTKNRKDIFDAYEAKSGASTEMRYLVCEGYAVEGTYVYAKETAEVTYGLTAHAEKIECTMCVDGNVLTIRYNPFLVFRKICSAIDTVRSVSDTNYGDVDYIPSNKIQNSDNVKSEKNNPRYINGEVTPWSIADMIHAICERIDSEKKHDVLSMGCGEGDMAAFMTMFVRSARVQLFESVRESLLIAEKVVEEVSGRFGALDVSDVKCHWHDMTDWKYMVKHLGEGPETQRKSDFAVVTINNINFEILPVLEALAHTGYKKIVGVFIDSFMPKKRDKIVDWTVEGEAMLLRTDTEGLEPRTAVFHEFPDPGICVTIPRGKFFKGTIVEIH